MSCEKRNLPSPQQYCCDNVFPKIRKLLEQNLGEANLLEAFISTSKTFASISEVQAAVYLILLQKALERKSNLDLIILAKLKVNSSMFTHSFIRSFDA